jgi:hypothetical protein
MSASPFEGQTLKPAPSAKGTDDQKDLSSALAEDVCLPDAPGSQGLTRTPAGSPGITPAPNASPLHDVKHPQDPAHRQSPTNPLKYLEQHSPPGPTRSNRPKPKWWSQTGSNRRPHACKARALPTELWPPSWLAPRRVSSWPQAPARTSVRLALPRIGAGGLAKALRAFEPSTLTLSTRMVGLGRLERPTSPLSGVRSNHLSYRPVRPS